MMPLLCYSIIFKIYSSYCEKSLRSRVRSGGSSEFIIIAKVPFGDFQLKAGIAERDIAIRS
jgi:hypothetical protein